MRYLLLSVLVVSLVGVLMVSSAVAQAPGALPGFGNLGDEHEHASLLVIIFGDKFDFSVPSYQIKSSWIHFEDSDGTTIHRHSSGVMLGYLFSSMGITVNDECFVFPDGRQFCSNIDYSLKYYINHQRVNVINGYVIEEGDRILITYGSETPEQIEKQLLELDLQVGTSDNITIAPTGAVSHDMIVFPAETQTDAERIAELEAELEKERTPTDAERIAELEAELEKERGGGCLIATAAFGSEMAPQVQFLREIRDNTVLQTESGSAFMTGFNQFYYSFSPTVADYERENPAFKEAVKITLTPLLASLTLLQYADIDSESEMLGYGIGVILLNIGMYFVAPAVLIMKIKKRILIRFI